MLTTSASTCSWTRVAKAPPISLSVPAFQDTQLDSLRARRFLHFSHHRLSPRAVRVYYQGKYSCQWNQLGQQLKTLGYQLGEHNGHARQVSARPGETDDQTLLDRVAGEAEDDWDCRGGVFRRQYCRVAGRPTAAVRPRRRKPLTLRADARHHARIGILGGEQLVHHAQPRAARAFLVEEPEVAVGPLALAGCGDRIGRIAAGDHVEDRYGVGSRALEQGCAPGGRQRRLSVAIARRFRLTHFEPFVPPFLKKHNCLLP